MTTHVTHHEPGGQAPLVPSNGPARTVESRVARVFGLEGDGWMRHANPVSVWTRFSVLSLLALAIWSRDWLGWWCLVPVALALTWMFANPLFFSPPRSTRNWASKGVFGERIWAARTEVDVPPQFRSRMPDVANAVAALGLVLMAYGLVVLSVLPVVAGIVLAHAAKLWYLDRMVLLFEDVKGRSPEHARWKF